MFPLALCLKAFVTLQKTILITNLQQECDLPFTAKSTVTDSGFTARSFDAEINFLTRVTSSELSSDAICSKSLSSGKLKTNKQKSHLIL